MQHLVHKPEDLHGDCMRAYISWTELPVHCAGLLCAWGFVTLLTLEAPLKGRLAPGSSVWCHSCSYTSDLKPRGTVDASGSAT